MSCHPFRVGGWRSWTPVFRVEACESGVTLNFLVSIRTSCDICVFVSASALVFEKKVADTFGVKH